MSKSIKLKNNTFIDSSGVTHSRTLLSTILNALQVEYIVSQGTSGNWTWRKWSSGIAECWCNEACTGITCNTASAGTYYSDSGGTKTFNYPSGLFKSITNVFVANGQGSHSSGLYPYAPQNSSSTTQCKVDFRSFSSQTNANCPVYIHAYGKWK